MEVRKGSLVRMPRPGSCTAKHSAPFLRHQSYRHTCFQTRRSQVLFTQHSLCLSQLAATCMKAALPNTFARFSGADPATVASCHQAWMFQTSTPSYVSTCCQLSESCTARRSCLLKPLILPLQRLAIRHLGIYTKLYL